MPCRVVFRLHKTVHSVWTVWVVLPRIDIFSVPYTPFDHVYPVCMLRSCMRLASVTLIHVWDVGSQIRIWVYIESIHFSVRICFSRRYILVHRLSSWVYASLTILGICIPDYYRAAVARLRRLCLTTGGYVRPMAESSQPGKAVSGFILVKPLHLAPCPSEKMWVIMCGPPRCSQ